MTLIDPSEYMTADVFHHWQKCNMEKCILSFSYILNVNYAITTRNSSDHIVMFYLKWAEN